MSITSDVQTLEPGSLVILFEVDATSMGAEVYRFHGHRGGGEIIFQGLEYTEWPIEAQGFEMTSQGKQPVPTLSLSNLDGYIGALCIYFDDLIGAKVTRRRTLTKYLDGHPEADPNEEMPPDIYFIEKRSGENDEVIIFELSSALDFQGIQLPRGVIIANTCAWLSIGGYRGPYCGYNGPPVATEYDIITTDANLDRCGGLVRSCKLRFGENNELNYGSFPAAGLIR